MSPVELKRQSEKDNADSKTVAPVAVITGAGRGIGRSLVDVLRTRGYTVIAVVRTLGDVSELSNLQNVFAVCCDVTESATETVLKEFIHSRVDKVDLLVNNAGFGAKSFGIEGLVFKELEDVLAVSCYGPIRCTKACLPMLRKSKGAVVVNISSRFASLEWVANGVVPHSEATYAYRIGKAAMNMFTSCLSIELKSENIKVLAVDPGKVKTRFGPKDADVEPEDAAKAIVDLVESTDLTGLFVRASGEKLPW